MLLARSTRSIVECFSSPFLQVIKCSFYFKTTSNKAKISKKKKMGSAGSVEQAPAQIITTPARPSNIETDHSNHNTINSSVRKNLGLTSPTSPATTNNTNIEYIGVWEYKLGSSSGCAGDDGSFISGGGGDEEETEGWTSFASSDQDRLENVFANRMQNMDDDSKTVMVMVGKTGWNVDLEKALVKSDSKILYKMSRGSGHTGTVRRKKTEKPDANAPSTFGDDHHNNSHASRNLNLRDEEGNLNELASTDNRFEVYMNSSIKAHSSLVYCIDFSRDGQKVLSGSRDGTFRYWELGSSQVACDYQQIKDGVILSCAIAPNNRFAVAGSSNSKAYLWSTEKSHERAVGDNGQFQRPIDVLAGHTHKVYGAKFTSDSTTLVTGAMDHSIRTWDVAKAVPIRKLVPHTAAVFTVATSRQSPHLALSGADDHLLVSHDLRTPNDKGVGVYRGHKATIWASDIRHDDGLFVSAGMDGACLLWDPRNGSKPLQHVGDHGVYPVHCAEFLPEGNFVMTSARDSTFRIWDINVPTSKAEVPDDVTPSNYSPTIKYPCCRDLCKVTAHQGNVFKIAFEPRRNKIMSCGSDGLIKIWDLKQNFQ